MRLKFVGDELDVVELCFGSHQCSFSAGPSTHVKPDFSGLDRGSVNQRECCKLRALVLNTDATLAECGQLIRVSPVEQGSNRAGWANLKVLEVALRCQTWQRNQANQRCNIVGEQQVSQVVFSAVYLERLL